MKTLVTFFLSTALIGCSMSTTTQSRVIPLADAQSAFDEAFRPQVHFTPPQKWMNDPNGMFYLDGEYHLFYQHNPDASVWGPMHWGHAVSKDLIHWEHLPIALYPDELGTIFSGSAVVDWNNTSGLGSSDNPPIVALYTYHNADMEKQGRIDFQTQAMAYSLDKGRTWTKYADNPIIDNPGIKDFRDPKVMWHAASDKWVMVLAQKDHIGFYSSDNLIDWQLESTFGEEIGSHGGVWECPELLYMPVEGSDEMRYVLLVSISPGGPNGGSATQYFVGDFDGKTFTLDDQWQAELTPQPAQFPAGHRFADFEQGAGQWQATGNAFVNAPTQGGHANQPPPSGFEGEYLINSFADQDRATGTLVSNEFVIEKPFINFLIGGGQHPDKVGMQLLVGGKVVKSETGKNREVLHYASWDVSEWQGKAAQLRILDQESGSWGHTYIDQITFADAPASNRIEPAIWLDYGTDNYAGVTFFTAPDAAEKRPVFMGWMSNWLYANQVPTETWRSAMTLPRTLHLQKTEAGLRVGSRLVREVNRLSGQTVKAAKLEAGKTMTLNANAATNSAIRFDFTASAIERSQLALSNGANEKITLTLDPANGYVTVDRTQSGNTAFHDAFANVQSAPLFSVGNDITVTVVADRSSVEVFVNDGLTVVTALVFPETVYDTIEVSNESFALHDLSISRLQSVWQK